MQEKKERYTSTIENFVKRKICFRLY